MPPTPAKRSSLPAQSPANSPAPPGQSPSRRGLSTTARATLAAAALLLAWDTTPLDISLARWAGSAQGFPLREHWLLVDVVHQGGRGLSFLLLGLLCVGARWPFGPLRALPLARRLQLVGSVLLGVALVSVVKSLSHTSCPWDLQAFGGAARHVSHWFGWWGSDGGGGRCFPAGHASAGFAFVGGYFAFRHHTPAVARQWLVAALALGFVLGLGQQWRGAHFMSHTFWSAWLCWCSAWALDVWLNRRAAGRVEAA